MPRIHRSPSHAGSWYSDDAEALSSEIDSWLDSAGANGTSPPARAIIAPHAGYRYCGHVMAHAYNHIQPSQTRRVFLLGPSHHVYSDKCSLSPATHYSTPFGEMRVDQEVYARLKATELFDVMGLDVDEAEHSLELHTPYIMRVMRGQEFTLVPIMVGALTTDREEVFGRVLGPYLDDPQNVFVVSSDFCHWGSRFRFQLYNKQQGPIWQYIQWLDGEGIKAIETGDPQAFASYQAQYKNTICGRHPIGVLLNMLQNCRGRHKVEFKQYDQSSRCTSTRDSSVSYAAAVVTAVP